MPNECSLCGNEYAGSGCNPHPFSTNKGERCCQHCDDWFVTPARCMYMRGLNFGIDLGRLREFIRWGGILDRSRKMARQHVIKHVKEKINEQQVS